ncbi:hypothetical protein LXL04_032888 [Taraxacum kok-saghyz]
MSKFSGSPVRDRTLDLREGISSNRWCAREFWSRSCLSDQATEVCPGCLVVVEECPGCVRGCPGCVRDSWSLPRKCPGMADGVRAGAGRGHGSGSWASFLGLGFRKWSRYASDDFRIWGLHFALNFVEPTLSLYKGLRQSAVLATSPAPQTAVGGPQFQFRVAKLAK